MLDNYRNNPEKAVKLFRPVLRALSTREKSKQRVVYIAEFDSLEFLSLDNMRVRVLRANLKTASGLFFLRNTGRIIDCYIVINDGLYSSLNGDLRQKALEKIKFTGVHEFVHFLAAIYMLTSTTIERQREIFAKRLESKTDVLNNDALNRFFAVLLDGDENFETEFGDRHFRIDHEDVGLDYSTLFNHLMFSKELFEARFDSECQKKFSSRIKNESHDDSIEAVKYYLNFVMAMAEEKGVMKEIALKQALSWVYSYLK